MTTNLPADVLDLSSDENTTDDQFLALFDENDAFVARVLEIESTGISTANFAINLPGKRIIKYSLNQGLALSDNHPALTYYYASADPAKTLFVAENYIRHLTLDGSIHTVYDFGDISGFAHTIDRRVNVAAYNPPSSQASVSETPGDYSGLNLKFMGVSSIGPFSGPIIAKFTSL